MNSILARKAANAKVLSKSRFFKGPRKEMIFCVGLMRLQFRGRAEAGVFDSLGKGLGYVPRVPGRETLCTVSCAWRSP